MKHAALGFRAHSGWAAAVVVAGPPHSPVVIDRRKIELADRSERGSMQPYHAAQGLDLSEAEKLIGRAAQTAQRLAQQALAAVRDGLRERGHDLIVCGILLGSGRPATTLAATLAAHTLIHTAEGELFRAALREASASLGLPVTGIKERELYSRAAAELHLSVDELRRRVTEWGRSIGPPWRQDEKLAAVVGCLVLAKASQQ